jgi:hypothetical protein
MYSQRSFQSPDVYILESPHLQPVNILAHYIWHPLHITHIQRRIDGLLLARLRRHHVPNAQDRCATGRTELRHLLRIRQTKTAEKY